MPIDSQIQMILDQLGKFNPQPIENLTPIAARNNPTLKNAVEVINAESAGDHINPVTYKPPPAASLPACIIKK